MSAVCWNCGGGAPGAEASGRFCTACKALQPPATDYFEFFELPRQLVLDPKDLEKRFYALSRQLHPDLFSRKSSREQEYSLESAAVLNDAYRVLKDPIARALYVLKLEGFDTGEQTTKDVPPELLEEVFELNMALEELRMGDTDVLPQLEAARLRFENMRDETDAELQTKFGAWDASHERNILTEIRGLLNRRKYVTNLIDKASHVPDRV
ncbi:MAG: molecular chaperone HscB [Bryobacterales bacterium]|nr:molecular chaperone HscB [Bryobacterales bacterium]